MQYLILHESRQRMRLRVPRLNLTLREADILEAYLNSLSFVKSARVHERTGDAIVFFVNKGAGRPALLKALDRFSFVDESIAALAPEHSVRAMNRRYQEKMTALILGRVFRSLFFPKSLQIVWTVGKSVRFLGMGLKSLLRGRLEVSVLDAAAIAASMLRGDFSTASSVMFLLQTGDLLEDWTHRKSVNDLASTMSLKADRVWKRTDEGDVLTDVSVIRPGDRIVVRTSNVIPLDGRVVEGEASVNQASMTGESVPVIRRPGGYVYAGTIVEEGGCVIEVTRATGSGRYDQIVRMIEESEKLKSGTEERAFHLADRLVPYSLGGAALTWLLTRNIDKAVSFLMVDFSCALKLSMPLSVLSAIREAGEHDISVKGGKFLEAVAEAKTIVFDKTGTLTHATPSVVDVVTFDGTDATEDLRIAACLEEHYPHSIANAIVRCAGERGIRHDEMHSKVEYVVAHGISSRLEGHEKAVIGSYHFVFEDEGCVIPENETEKFRRLPTEYSHLFMAIDGRLKAAICIFDPLRGEAAEVVDALHKLGLNKVCMMTGDNEYTASAIARKLDLDEYHAEVLPRDKAEFIQREHEKGRRVIMIGDGVNDTPALSEADAGIAVSDGAAIAREIADITISSDSLWQLVTLRKISRALMKRINENYRFIIGFNASLIAFGVLGILSPATSALLHNGSTLVTGIRSMSNLLKEDEDEKA
ncbi:MAG: heavy metal translocating P-type ATPase [Clostridiales bacterium]|uniref:heavy metal translocating P-type ATPase n=1 Tax=Hornefia butyriciproducens TaxID=2652293 RepID=UPI002A91FE09|nr:heavy metal translocating P-type ATPase [Hornefia butyriciproducens]MCI7679942.1 heavy metal translocating P-type ATPase [Clostridiales bacterium]MDY5462457.1 heavy metal translocating P-type ATPase [Hornefia butyriciproducens]